MPLWTNRYDGSHLTAIAVDSSGNVFVAGALVKNRLSDQGNDYLTIKYSNAGLLLWTNSYNGPFNDEDGIRAIAVDSSGNVFVTGNSGRHCCGFDYATVAYSNSGVPLWTNYYDGPAQQYDLPSVIAVDAAGNVFVTGYSVVVSFDPLSIAAETIAYSNAGDLIWENRFYGPDNQSNNSIAFMAVDSAGNVIVIGQSANVGGPSYFSIIKYSSSLPPPVHLDFQKLNNQLVLSWTNAGFSLQTAPAGTGPFTNLLGATSPYTNVISGAQKFFRLIRN